MASLTIHVGPIHIAIGSSDILKSIDELKGLIMTTLADLPGQLAFINAQLAKARDEIIAKIADLEDALKNITLPPEAEEALTALKGSAQGLDDLNVDAPPPVA
jgi:hypothetical protein